MTRVTAPDRVVSERKQYDVLRRAAFERAVVGRKMTSGGRGLMPSWPRNAMDRRLFAPMLSCVLLGVCKREASPASSASATAASSAAVVTQAPSADAPHQPSASALARAPSASAAQPEGEWAWLDGPPDPEVELVRDIGWLALQEPKGWIAEAPGWDGYMLAQPMSFTVSDADQAHWTARLVLCDVASTAASLDSDVASWLLFRWSRAREVVWDQPEPAKLGGKHIDVLAAHGHDNTDATKYWRIELPQPDGRVVWRVGILRPTATPKARRELESFVRSPALAVAMAEQLRQFR